MPHYGRAAPPSVNTLYVLNEPTVGLHMADVEKPTILFIASFDPATAPHIQHLQVIAQLKGLSPSDGEDHVIR